MAYLWDRTVQIGEIARDMSHMCCWLKIISSLETLPNFKGTKMRTLQFCQCHFHVQNSIIQDASLEMPASIVRIFTHICRVALTLQEWAT